MLINGKTLLNDAHLNNYAIPAFGFVNLEGLKAIIIAAEALKSPVIIQTTPGGINYAGFEEIAAMAVAAAKKSTIPVCLHLDHGKELDTLKYALNLGYTSVMMDGSHLNLNDNIAISLQAKKLINNSSAALEKELGIIGGKEDDLINENEKYTSISDAKIFIDSVKPDSLEIAVSTAHGIYHADVNINFALIKEIKQQNNLPLVLHASSGVANSLISNAVENGINKVNFDTELKQQLIEGILEYLKHNPNAYDIRKIFQLGIDKQVIIIKKRIIACKANSKALHF